jgi:hypothetical protein
MLFKEKNVAKWGIPAEDTRRAVDSINDAEGAFSIMLPTETRKLEYLSEESAYFTNQVYKEARRIVMQDYVIGRWHFVDLGEQMHRHIYEMNLSWGQMLDFYTDLNNARKEKDDKYVEDNHIGEEIIEPDETGPEFSTDVHEEAKSPEEDDAGNLLGALKEEIQNEEDQLSEDASMEPVRIEIKTSEVQEQ